MPNRARAQQRDIESQLTDVLRRLREARDSEDLNAEIALEPVLNYGIEKWAELAKQPAM